MKIYIKSDVDSTINYKMEIQPISGINGDRFTIFIYDGDTVIDKNSYSYGYNVSYSPKFVSPNRPLDKDIIEDWKEKYNIPDSQVYYLDDINVFKS